MTMKSNIDAQQALLKFLRLEDRHIIRLSLVTAVNEPIIITVEEYAGSFNDTVERCFELVAIGEDSPCKS